MIMKPEPNKLEKGKGSLEHNKKSVLCFWKNDSEQIQE
jgi:hypothetical protein